jgi:hypothetical protein
MGRLINLEQQDTCTDAWVIPGYLCRYDQRMRPWPNDLFPYEIHVNDFLIQLDEKILIRRCIEQECNGDVAIKRVYSTGSLVWTMWFQHAEDLVRIEEFVKTLTDRALES